MESVTGDTTMILPAGTGSKVTISGPTATDYATGLTSNDLVNKQYVDTANTTKYFEASATGGQTVVNTTPLNTTAKTSTTASLQVFVNGVFQQEGATKAYTVTGANQITFNAGLILNDDIVIYGFY